MAGCPLGGAHGRDLGSTAPTHTDPGAARARHNPTEPWIWALIDSMELMIKMIVQISLSNCPVLLRGVLERIRRVTAAWLRAYRVGWCEIRFDVLAVLCPQDGPVTVEHLQGAF
jgi:hypothetical protein